MPLHTLPKQRKQRARRCRLPADARRCRSFCIRVTQADFDRVAALQEKLGKGLNAAGVVPEEVVKAQNRVPHTALLFGLTVYERKMAEPAPIIMDTADAARAEIGGAE